MNTEGEFLIPLRDMPIDTGWRFIHMMVEHAALNMAIDEALLLSYRRFSSPQTIRIYGWSRPSVTYGYRIDPAAVNSDGFWRADLIRRPTGGGVVYHRECMTISMVGGVSSLGEWARREGLPRRLINRSSLLYRAVNSVVRDALSALGIESSLVNESTSWNARLDCFSSPCAYDIISGRRKIYGAAQLRVGRAFLYQGNLLVGSGFEVNDFGRLLREALEMTLGWKVHDGELSAAEKEEAERLSHGKYSSSGWNRSGRYRQGKPVRGS